MTEPRTPLTLEYEPVVPDEEEAKGVKPLIVAEPSFTYPGTIFVGVHPFGKRLGVHLLPGDAERLRNHLSKLLMEEESSEVIDWQERDETAAARRPEPSKPRLRLPIQFRFEFAFGRFQGVVGTSHD